MKLPIVLVGLALFSHGQALCPFSEHAVGDVRYKRHPAQQDLPAPVEREAVKEKRQTGPGGLPFTTFSEDQLIDVTGEHAWAPPKPGDLRGPCPGLNALANHGYFPRTGIVPLAVGAAATAQVYGE